MINFDDYFNENKTKHNKNWPYTCDRPYRILIIRRLRILKNNVLLNLIENQPDIDKIFCMQQIHMKQNIYTSLIKEKV